MAVPSPLPSAPGAVRDHQFHPLRIRRVVEETADARSYVLDVPPDQAAGFAYDAGQFCTFRVWIDGEPHLRCYSMSSTPGVDDELAVTVKRVPGGLVSNWMIDHLAEGDEVEATQPAGVFRLTPGDGEVLAFAAGSGITPIWSLVKAALAGPDRRLRLLYANRDRASTIFGAELDALAGRHPDRLEVVHHLDVERGFVDGDVVRGFAGAVDGADVYLCGPTPFMDIVEEALLGAGVAPERMHVERFTPAEPVVDPAVAADTDGAPTRVTVTLGGRTESTDHHPGTTILQTARQVGLNASSSCESGSCATCMAILEEGEVTMRVNNALTEEEVAEGWILTCQAVPTGPAVKVVYEG